MKWVILAVGRLRRGYAAAGVREFVDRIARMHPVEMTEVPAGKGPRRPADEPRVRAAQSRDLLARIRPEDHVILLDARGPATGSEAFAAHLTRLTREVRGRIVFVVGGAYGVDEALRARASERLSLGPMTLPHELARLVLTEQLYRALTIQRHLPYHHA